jgi:hypothetical protein
MNLSVKPAELRFGPDLEYLNFRPAVGLADGMPVVGRAAIDLLFDIVERPDPLKCFLGDLRLRVFQTSWKSRRRCAQHAASRNWAVASGPG